METETMQHHLREHEPQRLTLSLAQAEEYVNEAAQRLVQPLPLTRHECWGCVDGRRDDLERYAGPGATLGAFCAVCSALEDVCGADQAPSLQEVYAAAVRLLGGLSGHTDDHQPDDAWHYAGCGHCAGALREAHEYGLPHYAPSLHELVMALRHELPVTVLTGRHEECAVLVLASDVVMRGRYGDTSTFVFHADAWRELLCSLASEIANQFQLDHERLRSATLACGQRQLEQTLSRLAAGLPVYQVSHDGRTFVVTEIGS